MDKLERSLIQWLKDILHARLLISAFHEAGKVETPDLFPKQSASPILLSVWISRERRQEIWFLNEKGIKGNDRLSSAEEKKRLVDANLKNGGPYNPFLVSIRLGTPSEESDCVAWPFEADETVEGTAGGGYQGDIIYDRRKNKFAFRDVIKTVVA